jgi:uncharacterized repeat protein (TIGR02059 family)
MKIFLTKTLYSFLALVIATSGFSFNPATPARADDPANPFVNISSPVSLGGRYGTSFSPNAAYMAVSGRPAKVYKRNCGATYNEVASLSDAYGTVSWDAAFSPDGTYVALGLAGYPYVSFYKRSGDSFNQLADPAALPPNTCTYAAWSPDGTYAAFSCNSNPRLIIYKRSGDTFTKLPDPAFLPTWRAYSPSFSPDGTQLAVGSGESPFIVIYSRSGDTFTKIADPAVLPTGNGIGVAYSPTGNYLAVAHWETPFITIYSRSGSTFTKLANPAGLPPGDGTGVAWSHDATYLAMVSGRTAPVLATYQRSGDTFSRLASPYVVPGEWSQWVRFGYDSVSGADFLAVPYEWGLLMYSLNVIPPCDLATNAATYVSGTTAQLNARLGEAGSGRYNGDPAGGYTNYGCALSFEYGLTPSYGSTAAGDPPKTNGASNFSSALSGLSNLTTYHYRARAVTAAGTALGSDMTFTTTAAPPTVLSAATNSTGKVITVTFSKAMSNPAGKQAQFSYGVNGAGTWPFETAALNADSTKIELTISPSYNLIAYGKTVTLNYTLGTVTSADGGPLQSFTGQAVTNNMPRPPDPPTVVSAVTNVAGTVITVAFDKAMANPAGKQAQFKYQIGGGADQPFSSATLDADTTRINLTCSGTAIAFGNIVTLLYSSGTVAAADGGVLASFSGRAVTNNMMAPPTVASAATNTEGTVITVTFSKAMADPAGKQGQFYYSIVPQGNYNFTAAALNPDNTKIDLMCETLVPNGHVIRVSYGPGTVTAADGGKLGNFYDQNVTNNVPLPGPTFVSATTNTAGSNITITFSKDMADPTGKQAQFTYQVNGGAVQSFSAAALVINQASKILLTRSGAAFTYADTITVNYTKGTVLGQDGSVLQSFSARPVTNAMTTPPLFVSAITGQGWFGSAILVTFNRAMGGAWGKQAQFKFKVNGTEKSFTAADNYGNESPIIYLAYTDGAIAAGDTVTISYTRGTMEDYYGGVLESFTDQPVSNNFGQAPVLMAATVPAPPSVGRTISLFFSKFMEDPAGKQGQFSYRINGGTAQPFSAAALQSADHSVVDLTCPTPYISYGDTVTVSYVKGTVAAADGGLLASFTDQPVTNNMVAPPTFVSAETSDTANFIHIYFSKNIADPSAKFGEFSYSINGGVPQPFNFASGADKRVTLYCTTVNILPGDTVTVSYTRGTVVGTAGGVLASFSNQPVTNKRLAPVVTHAASDAAGSTITLNFSKTMSDPTGKEGEFTYKINGGSAQAFSAIAYGTSGPFTDNTVYVLTLGGTGIFSGNTVTLSYAGTVTSSGGDPLASFTNRPVINNVGSPTFVSAATNTLGAIITVNLGKDMADPLGKQDQFSYTIGGVPQTFAGAGPNTEINKIDLYCNTAVSFGDTVQVNYTQDMGNPVLAANGNPLESFGFQAVTNNVPDTNLKAITAFTIPLQVGPTVINEGAHTIAVTMPSGTNRAALVPTITHTGASVSPASGVAHDFTTNPQSYTVTAANTTTQAYTVTVNIQAGPAARVRVETAADGSGTVAPAQNVPSGSSITVYAISRDTNDIFIANVAATAWSLQSITGGVVSGDLVPAGDGKSAVLTGHIPGTAQIRAASGELTPTNSGTQTVTPGTATQVRVETAANGSGTLVPEQTIIKGDSITVYAITRDVNDNFIANVAAGMWSLENKTGGVADGDLVPAGDSKSAVFTANESGTARIRATSGAVTPTDSGTLTVTAGTPTKIQVETAADGSGTVVLAQGLITGSSITVYAITRTAGDGFVANVAADSWSLQSATGGVAAGDLVAAGDGKSATFTGHLVGTAEVRAASGALTPTNSGTLTVVAGAASKVRVETAADGSGAEVPAQVIVTGNSITVYSISRDANNNFIANVAAGTWTLQDKTGGVADGDLVPAGDSKSAVFSGHTPGTAAIRATSGALAAIDSGTLTVSASAPTQIQAETAADGSGGLLPPQDIAAGSSVTGYAITRDASNNFIANVTATWSLQAITGGVVAGDLVPAGDGKSAVFTGHVPGTARIRATSGVLTPTDSGRLNVTAGAAAKVRVETAANGSGTVVPAQGVGIGSSITMYCITRDAGDNFVANEAATAWSLQDKTGGVVDGDLVPAGDMKSAVFTGHVAGTAKARATSGVLPATDSGTLTVSAIPAPGVTSVNPNSGQQGQTIASTLITGTNLTGATAVGFGAGITVNSFTVTSATQVTASITIAAGAAPGTRNVSVTTGGGTGTGNNLFTVTVPAPAPTITSVNPATATRGQALTVTITGTNLAGTTAASFGAGVTVNSITVNSPTQVTVSITIAPDAAAGARTISVTTPAGTGTWAGSFTVEQGNNMIGSGTGSASGSGTYGSGTSTSTTTTVTPPVSLPNVKNMSASINTTEAIPGEMVEVSTVVTNAGNASGTSMVRVYVNGQEADALAVTLAPGQSRVVKFSIPATGAGENEVTVNNVKAGSFTVQDNRASDVIFWASSVMVILALIMAVIYTWRRREGYYN